jgi:outer membrane receptor for ferrienterochelin and colicin
MSIPVVAGLVAGALVAGAGPARADQSGEPTLQELLAVDTVATTRSGVPIQRAPGIVRVFSRQDIERLGFETIGDVLATVPGIQLQQYRGGHQLVWVRGVQARYNDKVLLLVDGIPMRDGYYGHFNVDEGLPIENIEWIEVVSGPGSVLYGANAFAAVVSVRTRSKGNLVAAGLGTDTEKLASVGFAAGPIYAFADYFRTNGFDPKLNSDGKPFEHDQSASRGYALLKAEGESWKAQWGWSRQENPQRYRDAGEEFRQERRPAWGGASWTTHVGEGALDLSAYYVDYSFERTKDSLDAERETTWRTEEDLGTTLRGAEAVYRQIIDRHSITAGLAFQRDQEDAISFRVTFPEPGPVQDGLIGNEISRDSLGLFAQDVWTLSESTTLVAGARWDRLSDFDNELSWRLGLTAQLPNGAYGKALVGTAYRVPSYREYLDVVSYNTALEAEHLTTAELQVGWLFDRGDLNLTFFRDDYRDFIGEINVERIYEPGGVREIGGDEVAFNFSRKKLSGVELGASLVPTDDWTVHLGGAWLIEAKEKLGQLDDVVETTTPLETGWKDISHLSDVTMNLETAYRFSKGFRLGAGLAWGSKRGVPDGYQDGVPSENRDPGNRDAWTRVDLWGSFRLADHLDARFRIGNLLDRKIYSTPFGGASYDLEWPGRHVRVSLVYGF